MNLGQAALGSMRSQLSGGYPVGGFGFGFGFGSTTSSFAFAFAFAVAPAEFVAPAVAEIRALPESLEEERTTTE